MPKKKKREEVEEEVESESETQSEEESPKPKPKSKKNAAKKKGKVTEPDESLEEIGRRILRDAKKIKKKEAGKLNYSEAIGLSSMFYKSNKKK